MFVDVLLTEFESRISDGTAFAAANRLLLLRTAAELKESPELLDVLERTAKRAEVIIGPFLRHQRDR